MREILLKKKICLLGDSAVGKTSLIRRYVFDQFDDKYIATIGTKVTEKDLCYQLPGQAIEIKLRLMIWDLLGQEGFMAVRKSAYRGSSGAMLVCDITRPNTFESIKKWAEGFVATVGTMPMVLLANKIDLMSTAGFAELRFDKETVKGIASELGVPYYFTSAKSGKNVEEAFYVIGEMLIRDAIKREGLSIPEKPHPHQEIYAVLDQIMDTFCTLHGGQERAMPIVEEQFRAAGLDLLNPTIDGLRRFVEGLTQVSALYSSPEYAEKERRTFMKLIDKLEKS